MGLGLRVAVEDVVILFLGDLDLVGLEGLAQKALDGMDGAEGVFDVLGLGGAADHDPDVVGLLVEVDDAGDELIAVLVEHDAGLALL